MKCKLCLIVFFFAGQLFATISLFKEYTFEEIESIRSNVEVYFSAQKDCDNYISSIESFLLSPNGFDGSDYLDILFLLSAYGDERVARWLVTTKTPILQLDNIERTIRCFLLGSFFIGFCDAELQRKWMERFIYIDRASPLGERLHIIFNHCRNRDVLEVYFSRCTRLVECFPMPLNYTTEENLQNFVNNLNLLFSQSFQSFLFKPKSVTVDLENKRVESMFCFAVDEKGAHYKTCFTPSIYQAYNAIFWAIAQDNVEDFLSLYEVLPFDFKDVYFENLQMDLMETILTFKSFKIMECWLGLDVKLQAGQGFSKDAFLQIIRWPKPLECEAILKCYLKYSRCASYYLMCCYEDICNEIALLKIQQEQKDSLLLLFARMRESILEKGMEPFFFNIVGELEYDIYAIKRMVKILDCPCAIVEYQSDGILWTFEKKTLRPRIKGQSVKNVLELLYLSREACGYITLPEQVGNIYLNQRFDANILKNHRKIKGIIFPKTIKEIYFDNGIMMQLEGLCFEGPPPNKVQLSDLGAPSLTIFYLKEYKDAWEAEIKGGKWYGFPAKCVDHFGR